MSTPLLDVRSLTFGYSGEPVLEDVNLTVKPGEYLGLIGPNGSGKTTLLKLVLGILQAPHKGEIRLFGSAEGAFRERWQIGYVAQKAASFNSGFPATVEEVVATGLNSRKGLFSRYTGEDRAAVQAALEKVGMGGFRERLIGRLSGGQQQRVFIARALVTRPALLILDEPTVGIDVAAESQFYQLIRDLREQMGLTVILVSHDIAAVAHEVTSVACLNRKLFYHGSPDQFGSEEQLCEFYGHHVRSVAHHHHH